MSENNVNGITGASVTTTGIIGGTVGIGQYIVNDYVITIAEAEGDYGYTMTITRGTDTQTVTLYGLTPEQYNAMLGYLEAAQTAAQTAQSAAESAEESAQAAEQSAYNAGVNASSAASAKNAAQSAASNARSAASDAANAKNDAVTAKNAAEAAATRAETAAGQITGMTAEAETLEPGSSATASFLDGVLLLGIPAGANGADGNGILSITKTATQGNVDTYTITYTDGTISTFTVTNGTDGAVTSVAGKTGAVTLDAGDVSFDDQQAYNDGTVGAGLTNLLSQMGAKASTEMALGAYPTDTASGAVASFSDGGDNLPVKDLTISIEPVQSGSGDPSPDNVRQISGWTGANVARSGKNLCNPDAIITDVFVRAENASESSPIGSVVKNAAWNCTDYIKVKPNTTYTSCVPSYFVAGSAGLVFFADQYVESAIYGVPTIMQSSGVYTFTTPANCSYIRFSYYGSSGSGAIVYPEYPYPMLVMGTDKTYEPYVGTTYPITFPSEAGMVCAGTLDVTTGMLTVTHIRQDFTGSSDEGWVLSAQDNYIAKAPLIKRETTPISSAYPMETVSPSGIYVIRPINNKQDFATISDWLAYIAQTPLQVCYELNTPATYQLTPVEVLTLLGANTIYADTGNTTVTYRADPTLYADKRSNATRSIIAGIEPTMTASKAYSVGQLLIVGDTLYKVAASIASGATLTPGTNVNPTTVAEQLILLANA